MRAYSFSRCLGLVAVLSISGCSDSGSSTSRNYDINGLWLTGYAHDTKALAGGVNLEYVEFQTTGTEGDKTLFRVVQVCGDGGEIATGHVTSDGVIHVSVPGGIPSLGQENPEEEEPIQGLSFVDDHEWRSVTTSDGVYLRGQRVERVDCAVLHDSHYTGASLHSVMLQADDRGAFLYSAAPPSNATPNGLDHLNDARSAHLPLSPSVPDGPVNPEVPPQESCKSPDGQVVPCPGTGEVASEGTIQCSVESYSMTRQQEMLDVVAFTDINSIYPGGLLQGRGIESDFLPITIPRSGGSFTVTGLNTASGNQSFTVDRISRSDVLNGIGGYLAASGITGTAADIAYQQVQAYSASQFAAKLGISASSTSFPANVSASIDVGTDAFENVVVVVFTQVYYTVSYDTPEHPTSVFHDGEHFDDPDNQIGGDNPPLFVSEVKYGRQVLFFVKSSFGAEHIKAAMNGAYKGEAATGTVDGSLSNAEIMSKSTVNYVARGGDAGAALTPIQGATPDAMYEALKQVIAESRSSVYSSTTPAVPIAYTLKYLTNNRKAVTSYASTYDRRDCRVTPAHQSKFTLKVSGIEGRAYINLNEYHTLSQTGVIAGPYTSAGTATLELNDFLDTQGAPARQILYVTVSQPLCVPPAYWVGSGGIFELAVDGKTAWKREFHNGFLNCYATNQKNAYLYQYQQRVLIDLNEGKVATVTN